MAEPGHNLHIVCWYLAGCIMLRQPIAWQRPCLFVFVNIYLSVRLRSQSLYVAPVTLEIGAVQPDASIMCLSAIIVACLSVLVHRVLADSLLVYFICNGSVCL